MSRSERTKRQAIWLLRRGWLSLSEAAHELNVSRQTLRYWAETAGFDYRARRAAFIRRCARNAKRNNR